MCGTNPRLNFTYKKLPSENNEEMVTIRITKEVEKKGWEVGKKDKARAIAKNLLDVFENEIISAKTGLSLEEVEHLR